MVYKKFIKRGGKLCGPYYYESVRVGNKVISKYIGTSLKKTPENVVQEHSKNSSSRRNNFFKFAFLGLILALILFVFIYSSSITGKITLQLEPSISGEQIDGNLILKVKAGELIPSDSVVLVSLNNQIKEIPLSQLVSLSQLNGDYYSEGSSLSGGGGGYGFIGTKKVYPDVDFKLRVLEEVSEETPTEIPITPSEPAPETPQEATPSIPEEEITPETPEEEIEEEPQETPEETPSETAIPPAEEAQTPKEEKKEGKESKKEETTSETPQATPIETQVETTPEPAPVESVPETPVETPAEASPVTTQAIKENEIEGSVNKNKDFNYNLQEGETVEIKKNSVKVKGEQIEDSVVSLSVSDNVARVTTDYSLEEEGFGEDYLGEEHEIIINLNSLGISAEDGELSIQIKAQESIIAETSAEVSVLGETNETSEEIPENETIIPSNQTLTPEEEAEEAGEITEGFGLTRNIPSIEILKNNKAEVDLEEYFNLAENYSALEADNISLSILESVLEIIPQENFTGIRTSKITASRTVEIISLNETTNESIINYRVDEAESNEFNIIISESLNLTANITEANITSNLTFAIIKEIQDIEIIKNNNHTLNLEEYFSGAETYGFDSVNNLSLVLDAKTLVTVPDFNFVGERNVSVYAFSGNESLSLSFLVSVVEKSNIKTKQHKAVINRPVKWIKSVETENLTDSRIEIPKESENITIKTDEEVEQAVNEADNSQISPITGGVIGAGNKFNIFSRIYKWFLGLSITGRVIQEDDLGVIETADSKIVDISNLVNDTILIGVEYETPAPLAYEENISGGKRIIISGPELNYTDVLAYTELGNKVEVNQSYKIKLYHVIESSLEVTQEEENVEQPILENNLTKEEVKQEAKEIKEAEKENKTEAKEEKKGESKIEANKSEEVQAKNTTPIEITSSEDKDKTQTKEDKKADKLTGKVTAEIVTSPDNSSELSVAPTQDETQAELTREEVNFTFSDLDEDGKIDYIEWIVPHLSNQTYEIIIEISKAEHLDSNRSFVEDVYEEVSSLDGNYTTIPDGEYVRVTFESNLSSSKDITIYARAGCNNTILINDIEVPCDIYYKKLRIDELRRQMEE